jgi:hypothetical protein
LKNFEIRTTAVSFEGGLTNINNLNSEANPTDSNNVYIENRITRKMSIALEFLSVIYELKKEY